MGFDENWGLLRKQAAERQDTRMELNGTGEGPLPGLGGQDFAATPPQKKAAANTIENELEPNTKKATDWADETSAAAVKEFDGWDTGAGLKKVMDTWDKQVKVLMGRLSTEKGALRGAAGLFTGQEELIKSRFTPLLKPQPGPYTSGLDGL
ncbi:hypothetical protein ACFVXE_32685 [Streptomyces sp. NPDC058231]|uniref:hypothetical protein n=1 Tax=Streptomyces sp. NPDC058231 TaxID=3346392 RepID=UPI0036ECBF87